MRGLPEGISVGLGTVRPRSIRPLCSKKFCIKNLATNYFTNPAPI